FTFSFLMHPPTTCRYTLSLHDALPISGEPLEVQLIGGEEPGLWAELHSRRVIWQGRPALLTVARDISQRKSIEASLGRSKLQARSEEHTSELQSRENLVCRLLLEKKKT